MVWKMFLQGGYNPSNILLRNVINILDMFQSEPLRLEKLDNSWDHCDAFN